MNVKVDDQLLTEHMSQCGKVSCHLQGKMFF